MTRDEIAKILKELRIKAGMTQSQAATQINRKQQTLASWETGQSQPDANTLFVLCAMYGVSVDEAFGFKSKKTSEIPSQYEFSSEAAEVAEAYDKADIKSKNIARQALDLPLLSPTSNTPHIPDMARIMETAEAFAEQTHKKLSCPVEK